jgi:ribosome-binding factor A
MAGTDYARAARNRAVGIKAAQLADAIRDALAGPIQRQLPGFFVSITSVTLSEDKQRATIWVRTYPTDKTATALKQLEKHQGQLQHALTTSLPRRQLPRITFAIDTSVESEDALSSLLR